MSAEYGNMVCVPELLRSKPRFWSASEVVGGHITLEELAIRGELVKISSGLYWRGSKSRSGFIAEPPQHDLVVAVAGPVGWGYSGQSSASHFGIAEPAQTTSIRYVLNIENSVFHNNIDCRRSKNHSRGVLAFNDFTFLELLESFESTVDDMWNSVRPILKKKLDTLDMEVFIPTLRYETVPIQNKFYSLIN